MSFLSRFKTLIGFRLYRVAAAAALVIGGTFVVRSQLQNRRKNTDISKMFKGLPRLPALGIPRRYDLELRPDLNACKFDGKLAVTLDVVQDTKYLVLNAADLDIVNNSVWLRSTNSQQFRLSHADLFRLNFSSLGQTCLLDLSPASPVAEVNLDLTRSFIALGMVHVTRNTRATNRYMLAFESSDTVGLPFEALLPCLVMPIFLGLLNPLVGFQPAYSMFLQRVLFPSSVSIDAEDEILVLEFEETLPHGEAILGIEFRGTLNDHMKGFYRSTYVINSEKRNMAVTQFEPADARRCFPCWDEPSYKV
eukprot:Gb_08898 [translate_table: standard]